jgi:hypothetical protein
MREDLGATIIKPRNSSSRGDSMILTLIPLIQKSDFWVRGYVPKKSDF